MPVYSFYPQARGLQGEKIDALLASAEEARSRAEEILAEHPDASEVSIWCDDAYVGRVGNVPWSPPARAIPEPAATTSAARARKVRARKSNQAQADAKLDG